MSLDRFEVVVGATTSNRSAGQSATVRVGLVEPCGGVPQKRAAGTAAFSLR